MSDESFVLLFCRIFQTVSGKSAYKLEAIETIAKDFSADPEELLPTAGALESAKSYREKKAKPLWNKIVNVLRSLYRAYLDLKDRYSNLLRRYNQMCFRTDDMADRIAELTEQNKQLASQNIQSAKDLETLKQAFGKEKIESTLESTSFLQTSSHQNRTSHRKPR